MSKTVKIIIISTVALLLVAAIVCMVLFIPLKGKANDYYWAYGDEFEIKDIATVEKKGDEFKILQLADIQLWTLASDNKRALEMCVKVVEDTKPDLIVLTGDNVSGLTSPYLMKDLIKVFEGFKVPWATVFGNHDNEMKATVNYLGDLLQDAEYSLFKKGPNNLYGSGNYAINVVDKNGTHMQSLYMLDNGRYMKYPDGSTKEVGVSYEQQAWYKWNVLGMKKALGYTVPSMTFSHFAPPQMRTAIEQLAPKNSDGIYVVPQELGFGSCAYLPGVAPKDTGFFDLMKELKSTHAMFFGHDHENDASIVYDGVRMTYGLKAGPSPRPWNSAKEYGGTVITIDKNNNTTVKHNVAQQANQ